jgi:hypothetical protein
MLENFKKVMRENGSTTSKNIIEEILKFKFNTGRCEMDWMGYQPIFHNGLINP